MTNPSYGSGTKDYDTVYEVAYEAYIAGAKSTNDDDGAAVEYADNVAARTYTSEEARRRMVALAKSRGTTTGIREYGCDIGTAVHARHLLKELLEHGQDGSKRLFTWFEEREDYIDLVVDELSEEIEGDYDDASDEDEYIDDGAE